MTVPVLRLGAPGIYRTQRRRPPAFTPVRLDVAGFAGVAPRGPVDVPVAVESWDDYRWRFGSYEGPGLLPDAVAAFFDQGGVRAYVLRVSPLPRAPDPAALAARAGHRLTLGGVGRTVDLAARDEGSWGNRLTVGWEFALAGRFPASVAGYAVPLPDGVSVPTGTLLRLRGTGLPVEGAFAWVTEVVLRDGGPGVRRRVALVDPPPRISAAGADVEVDIVTVTVVITDSDPAFRREERLRDLGLDRVHPRFVGDVLAAESRLVVPEGSWPDRLLPPDPVLSGAKSTRVRCGTDRWLAIGRESFLGTDDPGLLPVSSGEETVDGEDPGATSADPAAAEDPPVHGVDRMSLVQGLGLLVVPDLLWSTTTEEPPVVLPPPPQPAGFAPCRPEAGADVFATPPRTELLDAGTQMGEVLSRQQRVVALAERQRRFVALLDVPPGLPIRGIARWRGAFASSYAAAYHPWLIVVPPEDPQRRARRVPPSAFAAGIVADRERRLGIPWGPANELAAAAVGAEALLAAQADELHLLDVNVFRAERDGFRLSAAHTLSLDSDYRQLSVRRLMTMLRLVLERQAQWVAFEPHTDQLRRELNAAITQLLRGLFRGGAFAGATEQESFFVRTDDSLNPPWEQALGRLVAEVGVAPSTPLEYLVLRISQDADGAVAVLR
jgi:hypothetical protein